MRGHLSHDKFSPYLEMPWPCPAMESIMPEWMRMVKLFTAPIHCHDSFIKRLKHDWNILFKSCNNIDNGEGINRSDTYN